MTLYKSGLSVYIQSASCLLIINEKHGSELFLSAIPTQYLGTFLRKSQSKKRSR